MTDNFDKTEAKIETPLTIRLAQYEDWKTIAEFNTRLAAESEGKSLTSVTVAAGVQALLSNPHHGRYFVASVGTRLVGQMMHTREWSDWRNGEIWWLQSVYVDPDFRRQGIFRSLYRHVETLAESTPGIVGVRLYVEQHNAKAIEVYRALGLKTAGYEVMERVWHDIFTHV